MSYQDYNIILASNSPRRKELLAGLDVKFTINTLPNIDESYPEDLPCEEVARHIATLKAKAYLAILKANDLLITADTVVILNDKVYGKPKNKTEAKLMLKELSGKTHKVVTGVTINTLQKQSIFDVSSLVTFDTINDEEIDYYVEKYNPIDKAGAYGIQEWIGYIAVKQIEGSYFNIMGLPVQKLYQELKKF